MKTFFLSAIVLGLSSLGASAQQPTPAATPEKYQIRLARAEESGQAIALIGNRAFVSVDGLKRYIQTLPSASQIYLRLSDQKFPGGNAFVDSLHDIEKLCAERNIKFVTMAPGFL
jgi:hypothetical protein